MASWLRPQRPSRFPKAKTDPIVFVSSLNNTEDERDVCLQHVLYRSEDEHLIELYLNLATNDDDANTCTERLTREEVDSEQQQQQQQQQQNDWQFRDLCQITNAPPISPSSQLQYTKWERKGRTYHQVIYRCKENRIHVFSLQISASAPPIWRHEDLMGSSSSISASTLLASSLTKESLASLCTPNEGEEGEKEQSKAGEPDVSKEIGKTESELSDTTVPTTNLSTTSLSPSLEKTVSSLSESLEKLASTFSARSNIDDTEVTPSNPPTPPPPPPITWTSYTPSSSTSLLKESITATTPSSSFSDDDTAKSIVSFSEDLPSRKGSIDRASMEDKMFLKWIAKRKPDDIDLVVHRAGGVWKGGTLQNSSSSLLAASDIASSEETSVLSTQSSPSPSPIVENPIIAIETPSKCLMVLKELVQTEESYVKQLQTVIDVFLVPMRNQQVITPNQIQAIFSNLEDLVASHLTFLNTLKSTINNIGQFLTVFIEKTGFMKDYIVYVNQFDNSTLILRKLCNEVPAFASFIKKCEENPRCGLSDIGSFMILPIQRVPRYLLLLRDLLKETPKESILYDLVCQALKKIKDLADLINEEKRLAESIALGASVIRRIKGKLPVDLDVAGQQLIKEGELTWFTKGNSGEKVLAYLYQKVFLICQVDPLPAKNPKSGGNTSTNELPLRLRAAEDFYDSLSTTQVTEFFDIEGISTFKITITPKKGGKRREYILGSATEKQDWLFILTQLLRSASFKAQIDKSKLTGVLTNRLTTRPSFQDLRAKNIVATSDVPDQIKPKSPLQSLFSLKKDLTQSK